MSDISEMNEAEERLEKRSIDYKNIIMLILDYVVIVFSYVVTLMMLTELEYNYAALNYLYYIIRITPFYALTVAVIFYIFKLYLQDYSLIGIKEVRRMLFATFISVLVYAGIMTLTGSGFPPVFYIVGGMLQFLLTLLTRSFKKLISVDKVEQ